jgi:magnesium/cobalt transport protein CorA
VRILTPDGSRVIEPGELPPVLSGICDVSCPVTWIHAELEPAVIQALDDIGLDEIAVKSLRDGPERPRVEEFADHLYISLFSAERLLARSAGTGRAAPTAAAKGGEGSGAAQGLEDAPGDLEPGERAGTLPRLKDLRLFVGQRWLISVGHVAEADYELLVERVRRQVFSRQRGPSFIAYQICEWLVETLQPALERLDDRIDALQDQVLIETTRTPMDELFSLKRDLVDLRRRVAPLRDVMQRLGAYGVLYVDPEAEVYFRDVHDDVVRSIELLDTYRDILSSALDLHLTSVSNRLNKVMKQLTVVATVFMPLSFIVGLFGTNFEQMPFKSLLWFLMMFGLLFLSLVAMVVFTWRRR